jgi:hypothetical protein
MSLGGTLVTLSVWEVSSNIFITIPTLEVVDLSKPGSQFSRVLAPKVPILHLKTHFWLGNELRCSSSNF